ncbi:family 43 glycosylhydrolase [Rubripirellula reticaptiva]|nr:family 43 glycosylhydrolase [Rubripirellula reticaptiva]
MKRTSIELSFAAALFAVTSLAAVAEDRPIGTVTISYSDLSGIGAEEGVMRRDPSDIVKVDGIYYVWYSKGKISPGYDATIWCATSSDGHKWTEKGMALAKGEAGTWEGASVFTPNILVAEDRYWLFYTGTSRTFGKGFNPDSKIGIAVSDSPDGPWERLATNPALRNSDNADDFDSHLIDDACLLVRDGRYWFYYKGRQLGKSPAQTQMGVAIADKPEGPYVKYENNPVIPGNHEVMVWPQDSGVAAMIGTTGPKPITRSILYSDDGFHFSKTHNIIAVPTAAGAYRPEAFTQSGKGKHIEWGVHIGKQKGFLPFVERFDVKVEESLSDSPDR